ncbi:hypothetical protein CUMW_167240 [Citrus unshiu]|uniref:Exonuclease domain-containing protein n=2 Tax=Citrus TaxID=2706 RepID=A0A2H5PTZ2_CITUN|nr:hypothetical protein CUMW_167240 [Citrus unshiu]
MSFSKICLSRFAPLGSPNSLSAFPFSLPVPLTRAHKLTCAQHISCSCSASSSSSSSSTHQKGASTRWRPMCLYFTQGKCTMMDDVMHLEKFNHDISRDLQVDAAAFQHKCSQDLDFFLVLDLEGKIEILEFPVLMIDAKTMAFVDLFHRFVRPSKMSEQHINKYIEGKYGKFGVDRGNWDLKTKVPDQCKVSQIKLPPYFMEWINLKDVFYNFYKPRKSEATGMMGMMKNRQVPMFGSHHLGIDDTKNITRVLQRMLADGARVQITARRNPDSRNVQYLFEDRI